MAGEADDYPNVQVETKFEVFLYVYDMTKGMAKTFAPLLLGKPLQGIWHTGIVAYGREYYFGSNGIESCNPCGTLLGEPDQIVNLGKTEIPYSVFLEYIFALGESTYRLGSYSLFEHNCNNFSQEVATFLTGKSIPQEILDLPNEVLNTPIGASLRSYLENIPIHAEGSRGINFNPFSSFQSSNTRNQQHTPPPSTNNVFEQLLTPPREFKSPISNDKMSETAEARPESERRGSDLGGDDDDTLKSSFVSTRKSRKYTDPPIIYPDIDGVAALTNLAEKMESQLNEEEKTSLKELLEYMTTDCGAWALGNPHLDLVGRLLNDRNVPPECHVLMLKVLQACSLKEDLILLLHQDRKDHHLMSYIYKIENVTLEEQEEISKLLCNLCDQPSCFDWLMYISEWQEEGKPCNNSKVTVRGATHCILNEKPSIQEIGAKFMFNLSLKEIFDDTASELSMAILQYLQSDLKEETAFQCLTALSRFMLINTTEIPALVKMLGPDLSKFKGLSDRISKLVDEINSRTGPGS